MLSLDAETDGLWGNSFAIGMIAYEVKRTGFNF